MRASLRLLLFTLCVAVPVAASGGGAETGELATKEEKIVYVIGLSLAQTVQEFELSETELQILLDGLSDGVLGHEPKVSPSMWARRIDTLRTQRVGVARERTRAASDEFLSRAQRAPGATRKPSGLIYTELEPGTGPQPVGSDQVRVHYHGTRADGSVFDSTRDRSPATFGLDVVIPCWTEGLQLMRVGGQSELVCPSEIAYGEQGIKGSIKPGAVLSFQVELLEIVQ